MESPAKLRTAGTDTEQITIIADMNARLVRPVTPSSERIEKVMIISREIENSALVLMIEKPPLSELPEYENIIKKGVNQAKNKEIAKNLDSGNALFSLIWPISV